MTKEATAGATSSPIFSSDRLKQVLKHGDILFAIGIIGILVVLLLPVPTMLLDFLLGTSVTFSVLILMTVLFIVRPLDFNSFPTILLIAAIFRLSLNIASTRLILANGHTGSSAAGHVIEAFGNFVMAGSVIIGAIVFAILTIINFVVITKGSGRIAEVAARFSLDAMPGKQMAIDADLSAGLIGEDVAKKRRKDLEDESTFFGAMDGASKFVRGDAIAGLLITFINFIGGVVIGVVQRDLTFSAALETYTVLTIGDGLVSQIPSIVVSTAAGLLVSKSGVNGSTEKAIFGQLGKFPQALGLVSALIFGMSFMPGIPSAVFILLSAIIGSFAWITYKNAEKTKQDDQEQELPSETSEEEDPISDALKIDNIKIELGYGLLPLINYENGNKLPDQVKALRKQVARDRGFIIPSVRIQDNMQLASNDYVIRIKDIECASGSLHPEMLMVLNPQGGSVNIPGEDTKDPAFGLPAKWISESAREEALFHNYTVVDPPTVITTHLTEIIKENITDLLSYAETKKLLDSIDPEHQKLADEVVPEKVSIAGIQRVLQNLLAEDISIRDLPSILEAVSEAAATTKNILQITEHVRTRLARQICHSSTNAEGHIPILALSTEWEQLFADHLSGGGEEKQLSIPPSKLQEFVAAIKRNLEPHNMRGENPVLMVYPTIRPYVRSVTERFQPHLMVLSQNEIHPKAKIKTLGQVA